jgi:hypothetical protein
MSTEDPTKAGIIAGAALQYLTFQDAPMLQWLTLGTTGIRINLRTGEVEIPETLDLDLASLAFWTAVRANFGDPR